MADENKQRSKVAKWRSNSAVLRDKNHWPAKGPASKPWTQRRSAQFHGSLNLRGVALAIFHMFEIFLSYFGRPWLAAGRWRLASASVERRRWPPGSWPLAAASGTEPTYIRFHIFSYVHLYFICFHKFSYFYVFRWRSLDAFSYFNVLLRAPQHVTKM